MECENIKLNIKQRLFVQGYEWLLGIHSKDKTSCIIKVRQEDVEKLIDRLFPYGCNQENEEALLVGIKSCKDSIIAWDTYAEPYPSHIARQFYRFPEKVTRKIDHTLERGLASTYLTSGDTVTNITALVGEDKL